MPTLAFLFRMLHTFIYAIHPRIALHALFWCYSMNINLHENDGICAVALSGRLDTVGAGELQDRLAPLKPGILGLALDMGGVNYLSSAGVRVLLLLSKAILARNGTFALAGVQPYCRDVIEMTGFADVWPIFETPALALAHIRRALSGMPAADDRGRPETAEIAGGRLRIKLLGDAPCAIEILGDIQDVLMSRLTPRHIRSKKFFETEYSIGLGGLGSKIEDYFGIMGEMITIGGTMVWLPTDGQDVPDFLIPLADKGSVLIRTGFNISIAGGFNELMLFDADGPEGISMGRLVSELLRLARARRGDFRGALGLAMRAEMCDVYSSGIRKSPILENAPANGKSVIDKSNLAEWMASDSQPRHRGVTALICGVSVDLTSDLSRYDADMFGRVFYSHPAHVATNTELMHNHAVLFKPMPMPEEPAGLEQEIKRVVTGGEFIDMRHLLDSSTLKRAIIGLSYIQSFRLDTHGVAEGHVADDIALTPARGKGPGAGGGPGRI